MRGLLEKDIRLLMHSKQTFVCFIALAVVLGVAQKSTFMLGYLAFFISAILVSTLSYDEMDHGFAFLFTLPINRKIYVREKYVFCMGGAVIVWSLTMMLYVMILNVIAILLLVKPLQYCLLHYANNLRTYFMITKLNCFRSLTKRFICFILAIYTE